MVWPGDVTLPNLRLTTLHTEPTDPENTQYGQLPLGIRPRYLQLYPLSGGRWQVLWLEQSLPGQYRFSGGTLDAAGEVERGPTAITPRPALEFSAAPTPEGNLIAFWNEAQGSQTGEHSPLYAALIDNFGRPYPAVAIAPTGRFPAVAVDQSGDLHLAWLEAGSGQLWTVHYATLSAAALAAGLAPTAAQQVGVFRLKNSQIIDGFVLGLDAANIYLIWNVVSLGASMRGTLDGLTFFTNGPDTVRSLTFDAAGHSVRWLTLANPPLWGSAQGAAAPVVLGLSAGARPAIVRLSANNPNVVQPIVQTAAGAGESPIGRPALSYDEGGGLYAAWSVFQPNGQTAIYVAVRATAPPAP